MDGVSAVQETVSGARTRRAAFLPAELLPDPRDGLYQGLYKRLRGFILDGVWRAGTRLPSSRALAADLGVSRNTAILAVEQLIADGWAESRSRSGVYVASAHVAPSSVEALRVAHPPTELPPFALQRPATDLFPASIWKQLQALAWAEIDPQSLIDADPAGDFALRDAIVRLVCAPRGLRASADQVLIVPSATTGLDVIAAALVRPGDVVAVEDPSRPAVRQLLRSRGARLRSLIVTENGIDPQALAAEPTSLACVAPAVQFPTGAAMPAERRVALIDWAATTGGWIIEDDRDSELAEAGDAPLAAAPDARAILVGSFNRLLFPGLCVAYMIAPSALVDRLRAAHAIMGGRASLSAQVTLAAFIAEGHLARHLRRRRLALIERRAAMMDVLGALQPTSAGLHMAVDLGAGVEGAMARLQARRLGGMLLDSLSERGSGSGRVLLGLGATPDQIRAHGPAMRAALTASPEHRKA